MTLPPRLGSCTLPPLNAELDSLWDAILDLQDLTAEGWVLVGGQMVMLHGLLAGRVATRASQDIDLLADLLTSRGAVGECVRAVRRLGSFFATPAPGRVVRLSSPFAGWRWPRPRRRCRPRRARPGAATRATLRIVVILARRVVVRLRCSRKQSLRSKEVDEVLQGLIDMVQSILQILVG